MLTQSLSYAWKKSRHDVSRARIVTGTVPLRGACRRWGALLVVRVARKLPTSGGLRSLVRAKKEGLRSLVLCNFNNIKLIKVLFGRNNAV